MMALPATTVGIVALLQKIPVQSNTPFFLLRVKLASMFSTYLFLQHSFIADKDRSYVGGYWLEYTGARATSLS